MIHLLAFEGVYFVSNEVHCLIIPYLIFLEGKANFVANKRFNLSVLFFLIVTCCCKLKLSNNISAHISENSKTSPMYLQWTLHLQRTILDSQRYPLNLDLINNVEENFVFQAWKVYNYEQFHFHKRR